MTAALDRFDARQNPTSSATSQTLREAPPTGCLRYLLLTIPLYLPTGGIPGPRTRLDSEHCGAETRKREPR